jgi:hypothetical protein
MNMETLILASIGMTSAFLAESCQGDRTQGKQSFLRIAKSTVEVHEVWHDIYVATETGGQIRAHAPAQERPRKSEGPTPRFTNITTTIFPQISKTAMCKPANKEGLLYFLRSTSVPSLIHCKIVIYPDLCSYQY